MQIMLPTLLESSKFTPKEIYKMMAAKFIALHAEHPIRQVERFFARVYERACQTGGIGDLKPKCKLPSPKILGSRVHVSRIIQNTAKNIFSGAQCKQSSRDVATVSIQP